jgi:hypothetical protein
MCKESDRTNYKGTDAHTRDVSPHASTINPFSIGRRSPAAFGETDAGDRELRPRMFRGRKGSRKNNFPVFRPDLG